MKNIFNIVNFFKTKSLISHYLGNKRYSLNTSPLGLGCMGMSESYYGSSTKQDCINAILFANMCGINFFDTADIYGNGENEILLGEAVKKLDRTKLILATKFGLVATSPNDYRNRIIKADRNYVFSACEASLRRLNTDYIDLYFLHRIDPNTPIEETISAMAELVKQGKVRAIGLSEVSCKIINQAHKIHPITAIETEYSLFSREPAESILPTCRSLGIRFIAYSPLGRGMLAMNPTGNLFFEDNDRRKSMPRFQNENLKHNLEIVGKLNFFAKNKDISTPQLALSWLLHKGDDIVPIFGAKTEKNIHENMKAIHIKLNETEIAFIDSLVNPEIIKGDRYPSEAMSRLGYK